jgi:hypothetical protein
MAITRYADFALLLGATSVAVEPGSLEVGNAQPHGTRVLARLSRQEPAA